MRGRGMGDGECECVCVCETGGVCVPCFFLNFYIVSLCRQAAHQTQAERWTENARQPREEGALFTKHAPMFFFSTPPSISLSPF